MQLYVKATSNYPDGMTLTDFEELGPIWRGESIVIPFGEERRVLTVVGWTDLFMGRPCEVYVVKARNIPRDIQGKQVGEPITGFLVYGGNSGVRVLDDERDPQEFDAHLPRGFGAPIVWVEDVADLPADVRAVVEGDSDAGQD